MRRFLVHRLTGDPAEIVRTAAAKPAAEQYRCLAQLCDPAAGGRNWSDAKALYHPTSAPNLQSVPARIAEWKSLETRCQARSGEKVPPTLRSMALLNLCPPSLYDQLMLQAPVATGKIPFDELESLIMTAVHRGGGHQKGIHKNSSAYSMTVSACPVVHCNNML